MNTQDGIKTADGRPMTNREMAATLFNIATVLRRSGSANPFRVAAYERCARALMGYPAPVSEILRDAEKAPFHRRWHIGKKLHAKIGEMAVSGALAQYQEMLGDLPPYMASLMQVPGIGPKRAEQVHRILGIASGAELVRAARNGRLSVVPGFGKKRVAEIASVALPDEAGVDGRTLQSAADAAQKSLFDVLPRAA